jgi:hypothetical protein
VHVKRSKNKETVSVACGLVAWAWKGKGIHHKLGWLIYKPQLRYRATDGQQSTSPLRWQHLRDVLPETINGFERKG